MEWFTGSENDNSPYSSTTLWIVFSTVMLIICSSIVFLHFKIEQSGPVIVRDGQKVICKDGNCKDRISPWATLWRTVLPILISFVLPMAIVTALIFLVFNAIFCPHYNWKPMTPDVAFGIALLSMLLIHRRLLFQM